MTPPTLNRLLITGFLLLQITLVYSQITVSEHLILGLPTAAKTAIRQPDDYLMLKKQYALSYNNSRVGANWVSWHVDSTWLGDIKRKDAFDVDADLPPSFSKASYDNDYGASGFDCGHMCPAADRSCTREDMNITFLTTNMLPQAPNNNRITWRLFEEYCRNLVLAGNELYIISGGYGQGGTGSKGEKTTIGSSNVTVPSHTWKVVVVIPAGSNDLKRITSKTRVIAIDLPNNQEVSEKKWFEYRVSVDDIEKHTGFNFLSKVSKSIQKVIEAKTDTLEIN